MEMVIKGGLGGTLISENGRANCAHGKSSGATRIRQAHLLSAEHNVIVAGGVSCLNEAGSPNAVLLRVAQIIIQSLKRMVWTRLFTHISQEISEVSPRWVDRDPAATVMWVHLMIRVRCAPDHSFPGRVFCGASRFPAVPMLLRRCSQASTRLGVAVAQLCCRKIGFLPACTGTYPANQAGLSFGTTNHGQLAEGLASEIQGASAKRSFFPAPTRFCVPTPQLCTSGQRESSANTAAFPLRRVGAALNNLQVVKCLSNKFHNVPLYRAMLLPSRATSIPFKGEIQWPLSALPSLL